MALPKRRLPTPTPGRARSPGRSAAAAAAAAPNGFRGPRRPLFLFHVLRAIIPFLEGIHLGGTWSDLLIIDAIDLDGNMDPWYCPAHLAGCPQEKIFCLQVFSFRDRYISTWPTSPLAAVRRLLLPPGPRSTSRLLLSKLTPLLVPPPTLALVACEVLGFISWATARRPHREDITGAEWTERRPLGRFLLLLPILGRDGTRDRP